LDYLPDASQGFKEELVEQFEYGEDWEDPSWSKRSFDIL
jgi:hypothetical protein